MGSLPALSVEPVDRLGLFELDGNAVQDNLDPPFDGDDWETLYNNGQNNGGSPGVFTGINPDPASPHVIFSGGVKDIQDVSTEQKGTKAWSWTTGSVPDKSDITNAYAASYTDGETGDRIIYFGADRISNNGDTFMGFWFFQDEVKRIDGGTFSGNHRDDDVLVLVNFPQANNAVPLIQVVKWDSSCDGKGANKIVQNNPVNGDCVANNLRLVAGTSGAGAICGNGGIPEACAITNPGTIASPWPYTSKDGFVNQFPYETFFEGGINITALLPESDGCFASFLAETRASSSFTADLKDFVLDEFPVCATDITTEIHSGNNHDDDIQNTAIDAGTGIHDLALITFSGPSGLNVLGTVTFDTFAATCSELLDGQGDPIVPLPDSLDTYVINVDYDLAGDNTLMVETNGWTNGNTGGALPRVDTDFPAPGPFAYLVRFESATSGIPDSDYHCEQLNVNQLTPSVVTRIHEGSVSVVGHADVDIQGGTVLVGTTIHDLAEVTGASGLLPTGTVSFVFYDNLTCDGNVLATHGNKALSGAGVVATAESNDFSTVGYLSNADTRGLSIKASYGGDTNYAPAMAACEPLTVSKRSPSIETHVILLDRAKVEGDGNSIAGVGDPGGVVDFVIYNSNNCTGTPLRTVNNVPLAAVNGDLFARLAASDEVIVSAPNTTSYVSYKATYKGDNNYKSVEHACEVVAVTLPAKTTAN
ncbi:Ig-like domain-containing protein [Zobellella denitrificans]